MCPPGDKAFDENAEHYINYIARLAVPMKLKLTDIMAASKSDPEILAVKRGLVDGNWTQLLELDPANNTYKLNAVEFCLAGDILLRGTRIVIPNSLRHQTIQLAHESHPGMTIMKQRLRSKVWWPKIDAAVEQFVKKCHECILVAAPNAPEPLKRKTLPLMPWTALACDFLGPLPDGSHIFAVVDYYSRFLEATFTNKIDTKHTIKFLHELFARHGAPLAITCDGGPAFKSAEFQQFCEEWGIEIISTIPYWPQQNGEIEIQNKSMLRILRISFNSDGNMEKALMNYLLRYRSCVHPTTGKSPAELLFGRNIRDKLPSLELATDVNEEVADRDQLQKEKGKVRKKEMI